MAHTYNMETCTWPGHAGHVISIHVCVYQGAPDWTARKINLYFLEKLIFWIGLRQSIIHMYDSIKTQHCPLPFSSRSE